MTIEGILRIVLIAAAAIGLMTGFSAYRIASKKRSVGALAVAATIWTLLTAGAGLYYARKIGAITAIEGLLLGGAVLLPLAGGSFAGRKAASGASGGGLAAACALLTLLDLGGFYRFNQQVVDIAAGVGVGTTSTRKYVPTANKDCPENLKSLYFAFAQFVDDNGTLPPADKWMDNPEIASKVQKDEWFHCPVVSNRHDAKFGYAYNDSIAGKDLHGKKLADMPDAAKTPLLYDSTDLAKSAHDALTSLPSPGRHNGKNNVLYCDGHVDTVLPHDSGMRN